MVCRAQSGGVNRQVISNAWGKLPIEKACDIFAREEPKPEVKSSEYSRKMEAPLQHQVAKEFSRALRRARKAATTSNPELAVEWCRYAATLAWEVNPGFFYCHEMEQLLAEIGRRYLRGSASAPSPCPGGPRHFLHLISPNTAYDVGGSSRAVSRWIEICAEHAPSEHHSILLTRLRDDPIPTWLVDSVCKSGGDLIAIPSGLSWLQAAAELRSRSIGFDAVILHIHPNDLLPNLAFFDWAHPVLYFRHSDHLFNPGLDLARVIADIRPVGRAMSVHFCAKAPRKVMLPLPLLDEALTSCDKADTRRKLGLPVDALVILTIGWPHKFIPIDGYNFSEVVQSLCKANSRVRIVAVGSRESELFPGLKQAMGGRFLPVGAVEDREILELYYRAADIYLDAYPTSSLTATLDAARHGLPVQRLRNRYRCLLWCDDPALDSVMPGAATQEEFIRTVLEWMEWPEEKRQQLGSRFREAVLRDHCGASWKSRWLDPAVNALMLPAGAPTELEPTSPQRDESSFPGLGIAGPESDWPAGMFIAGTILDTGRVPWPIRLHGMLHSIGPLFLDIADRGMTRMRLSMLTSLVAPFVPRKVRKAVGWMRGTISGKQAHQG